MRDNAIYVTDIIFFAVQNLCNVISYFTYNYLTKSYDLGEDFNLLIIIVIQPRATLLTRDLTAFEPHPPFRNVRDITF